MNVGVRLIAAVAVLALVLAGPLAPLVAAQQPTAPPRTDLYPDGATSSAAERHGPDVYDAGAVAVTAIGLPLKGAICALSGALGLALLVTTFGSAYKGSTRTVEEGCGQKWIITGDDLRPGRASRAYDDGWERD